MPHCIIEYSQELNDKINLNVLIDKAYSAILKSGLFKSEDIKIRAISFKKHQTGSQKTDFIHITVRILSGRNIEQRKMLSDTILKKFNDINISPISITVEICEIENESYSKLLL